MTIKASAGSAMILAAGLLVSLAGPPPAMAAGTAADSAAVSKSESAVSGKSARQGSRYLKKRYAHRKYTRTASKSAESRKADEKQVADASGGTPPAMPEWLANANAQMTAADAVPDSARGMSAAMSEKANTVLQAAADKPADAEAPADTAVAAPDQLNDDDRALHATPLHADGCDGLDQTGRGEPRSGGEQRQFHPGQDLTDRKDLHRLRSPADDGVGRANVHGVAGRAKSRRQAASTACPHLKRTPAAGTLPAKSVVRSGSWRRLNTSLSKARARSASSR